MGWCARWASPSPNPSGPHQTVRGVRAGPLPRADCRDRCDGQGEVLDRIDYDPFGALTIATNPALGDRYKFTGRELDPITGLSYHHARYDDPATGTWTTRDPLGFDAGAPNIYRYVGNSPTITVDPSGLAWWNPLKWLWTGDGFAKDEVLNAAMKAAGENLLKNSKTVEAVVDWTGEVDPTIASRLIKSGMLHIQARDEEIAGEVVGYIKDKATGKIIGRVVKGAKGVLKKGSTPKGASTPSAAPQTLKARQRNSKRREYFGQNPNKSSTTYRDVVARMRQEGKIIGEGDNAMVKASDGSLIPLKDAELAHTRDVMKWWNEEGKYWGPGHEKVREFRLDPNNYVLDKPGLNRSAGAKLKDIGYDPPDPRPGGPPKPPGSP